ncbi:MAG: leucine-rich repeat domain-containing protein [Bacteroides sp.]|nr:leucine-rich repeat domain-containing protein [Bacteroides sp.]MCM1085977.1 leucine-rich repeat domain-containing protein [Bacteroides sp.]
MKKLWIGLAAIALSLFPLQAQESSAPQILGVDCKGMNVTSLDISGCTALTSLSCYNYQLTSLDVSGCTALTSLSCDNNALTSLDVSSCTALTSLYCTDNQLTSLDVSKNTALTSLYCSGNQLTSLDVSGCTALTSLSCHSNQLTELDVSGCTSLTSLNCYDNQLTELEVSGCTNLRELRGDADTLEIHGVSMDILTIDYFSSIKVIDASGCTSLKNLSCRNIDLTSLDVSGCTSLTSLNCYDNPLTSLDVSGCTELKALKGYRDGRPDDIYVLTIDTLKIHGASMDTLVVGNDSEIKVIDAAGCTSIENLSCSNIGLTDLDVSGCTSLTSLDCSSNNLRSLDVSSCINLFSLDCSGTGLYSLNVNNCTKLERLACGWKINDNVGYNRCNYLTDLDLSHNTALTSLYCNDNKLTSLDVSKNTALTSLYCNDNKLTSLDVSKNTALTSLSCSSNKLTSLDVSNNTALISLYCSSNKLTSLDVSNNTALTSLGCSSNKLTSLDVSNNTALKSLDCQYNSISLSVLYEAYSQRSSWYNFSSESQSESIMLLIDNPWDLSSERIIGQVISTYELTDVNGKEVDAGFWEENRFEFKFHEPLKYTLKLQNPNVKEDGRYGDPVTFTWHISVVEEMPSYAVMVSSNNTEWGTATLTGNGTYEYGTEATVTASPKEGYRFVNWTKKDGTVFSTEATHTFKVTENLELTANFEKRPDDVETFTVTLSANNNDWGRVSISGDGTYEKDEEVTITATPNKGYRFVNWTKDGEEFSTEAVYTFAVTEDMELAANFEEDPDHVGNEGLAKDNFRVWAQDRVIHLSADKGDVQVYNALGQCLYSGRATAIPVRNGGLYIVRSGRNSYKVMVR